MASPGHNELTSSYLILTLIADPKYNLDGPGQCQVYW